MLTLSSNVKSVPVSGRVRMTYPSNLAAQIVSGVNPAATDAQLITLCNTISGLQTATLDEVFFTAESELTSA